MAFDTVTWTGLAGINVFWPLGGPVSSGGIYPADPYSISASGSWRSHVTSSIIQRDVALGIDHYRLQVCPAPLLQALAAQDTSRISGYLSAVEQAVDDILASGGKVIVSHFLSQPNIDPNSIFTGVGTTAHNAYAQYLGVLLGRLSSRNPALVAGDITNEPSVYDHTVVDPIMADWFRSTRATVSQMTLSTTSSNYSDLHTMSGLDYSGNGNTSSGLDITPYDANTLFEFHPFLPSPLCLQGASYTSNYKYLQGMSWPPANNGEQSIVVAAMTANVNADSSLTSAQKTSMINDLTSQIGYYYSTPQNVNWLMTQISYLEQWRVAKGITASRIYAGETGCVRTEARWPNSGNDDLSIARYNRDMNSVLFKYGYRFAVDHLDTSDYGLSKGLGVAIGDYRPGMLAGVGWERMKLPIRR